MAFLGSGVGFLLLALQLVTTVPIPELLLSLLVIPSFLAVFFVGLLGFYPYVTDAAPRLALGGVVTAAIGGICIAVVVLVAEHWPSVHGRHLGVPVGFLQLEVAFTEGYAPA